MPRLYDDEFRRLNIDRMLAEHDLNRRRHGRVFPAPQAPVLFLMADRAHPVRNISLGGFAFMDEEPLEAGWRLEGALQLPRRDQTLPLSVLVVASHPDGLVRCRIEVMGQEARASLAAYLNERNRELASFFAGQRGPALGRANGPGPADEPV